MLPKLKTDFGRRVVLEQLWFVVGFSL